jgi:hypothetical protein
METVSIRNLRGTTLRDSARQGKLLAITNRRALIGVLIPVASAWVEHIIDYNWSHVRESIDEGEQALAVGAPMATLDDVFDTPERLAMQLTAVVVGGTVAQAPESKEKMRRIQDVLNPPRSTEQEDKPAEPLVRTVRIGDLSGHMIEEAAENRQTLAITHERELIGIVIPVTMGLVQFLIEQNMSRVLTSIDRSEHHLSKAGSMTSLEDAIDQAASLDEAIDQAASLGQQASADQAGAPETATSRRPQ